MSLKLIEIQYENQYYYQLLLNQDLIYETKSCESNPESDKVLKSLYEYLYENSDAMKRWSCSSESMKIIKKYIQEE